MSIRLWPCTMQSIPTSHFGPSWGCAGGLSILEEYTLLLSIKASLFIIGVARVYFNSYHTSMVPGREGCRSAGRLCVSGLGATRSILVILLNLRCMALPYVMSVVS
jgi:hypothetical protein